MFFLHKHQFIDWYPEDQCHQTSTCSKKGCNKISHRVKHDLTDLAYISDDSCRQEQHCRRCDFRYEQDAPHIYSDFVDVAPNVCRQVRYCVRCNTPDYKDIDHDYSDWAYYIPNCCTQRRVCRRCGHKIYREHCIQGESKVMQVMGRCASVSQCPRCGERKFAPAEHKWANNLATHADCLAFRKTRYQQMLDNVSHQIDLYESNRLTGSTGYHEQIARRNDLQEKIAQDGCLLQDKSLQSIGARICERCLFIQRIGLRKQAEESGQRVFISYSHAYNVEQVWALAQELGKRGYIVTIDTTDLEAGGSISSFRECIRDHDYVLCIISSPYIESFWCMSEAVTFMREQDYRRRMLPILGESACFQPENGIAYINWWNEALQSKWQGLDSEQSLMSREIVMDLKKFLDYIKSTKAPSIADYDAICQWMTQI